MEEISYAPRNASFPHRQPAMDTLLDTPPPHAGHSTQQYSGGHERGHGHAYGGTAQPTFYSQNKTLIVIMIVILCVLIIGIVITIVFILMRRDGTQKFDPKPPPTHVGPTGGHQQDPAAANEHERNKKNASEDELNGMEQALINAMRPTRPHVRFEDDFVKNHRSTQPPTEEGSGDGDGDGDSSDDGSEDDSGSEEGEGDGDEDSSDGETEQEGLIPKSFVAKPTPRIVDITDQVEAAEILPKASLESLRINTASTWTSVLLATNDPRIGTLTEKEGLYNDYVAFCNRKKLKQIDKRAFSAHIKNLLSPKIAGNKIPLWNKTEIAEAFKRRNSIDWQEIYKLTT